jgi:hypothetical protein
LVQRDAMVPKPAPPPDLPQEIAQEMEAVGLKPEIVTLLRIISDFPRLQAEARARTEIGVSKTPISEKWPLKGLVPTHVSYETARKAAVRGTLRAKLTGKRWFATEDDFAEWLAKTGRNRR